MPKMDDATIQLNVNSEISVAAKHSSSRGERRQEAWDRYAGKKLGNEVKGRSRFITREVLDTVEWMMPYFMRTFASGDSKVILEIKGQEPIAGQAVMEKIQTDMADNTPTQFVLFYQWIKDALISDTAVVKTGWLLDQETLKVDFDTLNEQQMQVLNNDPEVQVESAEVAYGFTGVEFKNVVAKVKKTIENRIYAENTPHWEFIAVKRARDVNDDHPKGHITKVSVDYLKRIHRAYSTKKKPFFKESALKELSENAGSAHQYGEMDSQRNAYLDDDDTGPGDIPKSEKGGRAIVDLVEWYTQLDVDGDGYLEKIVCWMADKKLLGWEINKDKVIPFSIAKPIIAPYKFYGISYADLLIEIQNLKTMLLRRILDNFDYTNSGRWLVSPNAQVDLNALLTNAPGEVIFGDPDGVTDLTPKPFQPGSLSILEYVEGMRENRTGVTRYNTGMGEHPIGDTATGFIGQQSAAMQRLEHTARVIAETGIADFYKKCTIHYQNNINKPFVVKVNGEDMQITPEMLKGKVVARVTMGVEATVGFQEAQKIEKVVSVLVNMNGMFPGLLTPEKIHNIARRYVKSMGFGQIDDFVAGLKEYVTSYTQTQQQTAEMQQKEMDFEKRLKELELNLKGEDIQSRATAARDKTVQEEISDRRRNELGLKKIEQAREKTILQNMTEAFNRMNEEKKPA